MKKISFNNNNTFKFVQLTDIHFGENLEKDLKNQDVIRTIIESEQPDFVVVTGDVVSGYAWDGK